MTMKKLSCGEQGFTLIEVLTAIAVVSITVVVLMWVQNAAWKGTGIAGQQRQASILLQKQVDKLKEGIVRNNGTLPDTTGDTWITGLSKRGVTIEYRLSPEAGAMNTVRKVELRATYTGTARADTVQTYVARDF